MAKGYGGQISKKTEDNFYEWPTFLNIDLFTNLSVEYLFRTSILTELRVLFLDKSRNSVDTLKYCIQNVHMSMITWKTRYIYCLFLKYASEIGMRSVVIKNYGRPYKKRLPKNKSSFWSMI